MRADRSGLCRAARGFAKLARMETNIQGCEAVLAKWLQDSFSAAFPGVADFSAVRALPATDPRFGDFQCNDAMGMAKVLHRPPRAIAEAALAALPRPSFVEKAEIAGPGFINITVSPEWTASLVREAVSSPSLGIPACGAGKTVVMDYSSPNAAKQMHIGHIRSTVIGNALDRIFRALGYRVIADNHLGDWGTQFGILIKGYRECLDDAQRASPTVADLEKAYVDSSTRAKTDETWKNACRAELVKLQQGDPENRALWKKFIDISIAEFTRIYDLLGVKFDLWHGESYYNDRLPKVIEELRRAGLAEESEGALVVRFEEEKMPLAIVRKSDGGYNYTTTDIACAEVRTEEFAPERIVYVTDDRQQLHFKQFFAICAKLGLKTKLVHVPFGLMSYQGKAISTREGNLIKLDELLAEAERRALAVIRGENAQGEPSPAEKALARKIGFGAVKYADLSHDPATAIDFNWDKALALEGNSGPYLQYAHARVRSMLDRYSALPDALPDAAAGALPAVSSPAEKALALRILQFPAAVLRAAETGKPSALAEYLFGLSQLYSTFYQSSPVLKSEPAVRDARIALCAAFGRILAKGLDLLGIEAPERI